MSCTGNGGERELQITAYLDGELDLTGALDLERHLAACPDCARWLAAQRALQQAIGAADLRFRPAAAQAGRIRRALGVRPPPAASPATWWRQSWPRAIAALLLVAVGSWTAGRRWPEPAAPPAPDLGEQVLASHLRAQLSGRPEDVVSSDHHTVKPWFAGRLDYSPPVIDLAARGFPLRGGRLDYIGGRPVAALIYQAGNHLVSVMVWPARPAAGAEDAAAAAAAASSRRGLQLLRWSQAGMTWWAVSDVAADRLAELVRDLRAGLRPVPAGP